MVSRDEVILKLEELKADVKTWEKVLQVLDRNALSKRTGPAMRFYKARPFYAMRAILSEKGAQTQEELMKILGDGGIAIGKKRGIHNTRISLEKTLRTGALKKVGDLIGLPEWDESMFKQK